MVFTKPTGLQSRNAKPGESCFFLLKCGGDPLQSRHVLQPTLSPSEKRRLKGAAQNIEPVLKVGKNGITAALIASVDEALNQHGLIKIRFVEFKEEKKAMAEEIAAASGSALVQVVGHVAVFYRPRKEGA